MSEDRPLMKCPECGAAILVPVEEPVRLMYGEGRVITQQGECDGIKCLVLRRAPEPKPIGHVDPMDEEPIPQEECAAILFFNNIAGARTLQDELGELIAKWSREECTENDKEQECDR